MKKALVVKIVVMSLVAVFLIVALIYGIGSGFGLKEFIGGSELSKVHKNSMVNSYEYTQEAADLDSIDIEWIAGNVDVVYYDGDVIRITEKTSRTVEENELLVMEADGSTLKIKWAQKKVFFGFFNLLTKQLTVELPKTMALDTVNVHNVSASAMADSISAGTVKLSTVSGEVNAYGLKAEEIKLNSTSGRINSEGCFADDLTVNSTSGTVSLNSTVGVDTDISTVSGSVEMRGTFQNLHVGTVSGSINAVTDTLTDEVRLESVSGTVNLTVPEDTSARVNYSSVSGHFNSSFDTNASGKKGDFAVGSGSGNIGFSTTSGSMSLKSGVKSVAIPVVQGDESQAGAKDESSESDESSEESDG